MADLSSLKRAIAQIFDEGKSIALWWSGGSDSTLLLHLMLETAKPFGILRFDAGWSREQKRQADETVTDYGLRVFSYPAVANVLVEEGGEMALVSQYAIDAAGRSTILVRDLVDNPKVCAFDVQLPNAKSKAAPIEFDVHVMGIRGDDQHFVAGDGPLIDAVERSIGTKQFLFPLFGLTSQQVRDLLKSEYGVDLQDAIDTGDTGCCTRCFKSDTFCPKQQKDISKVDWDPSGNLAAVRAVLGR